MKKIKNENNEKSEKSEKIDISNKTLYNKPLTMNCYLCGKEYGTSSLTIHLKSCNENYIREKLLDVGNAYKNNLILFVDSLKPKILEEILTKIKEKKLYEQEVMQDENIFEIDRNIREMINTYNSEAESIYKEQNFFPCENCGRKFLPEKLEKHIKGCYSKDSSKGAKPMNPILNLIKHNSLTNANQIDLLSKTGLNEIQKKNSFKNITGNKLRNSMPENSNPLKISTAISKNLEIVPLSIRPLFLVCFICGREFGRNSLEIHLKSCADKPDITSSMANYTIKSGKLNFSYPSELEEIFYKLSKNIEVPNSEIKIYNQIATKLFEDNTKKKCLGCGRRFLPDRLEVHQRGCKEYKKYIQDNPSDQGNKFTTRPKMFMCPLCGREFGSMSLSIHMKTCKDKFDREQETLPYQQRRSSDKILQKYEEANVQLKAGGNYNIEDMNNEAYDIWKQDALVPCENCGRTFLPDRLIVHKRSCKVKK